MLSVGAQHARTIEEKAVDATSAVGMGYSESKWVAERLLELAASKTTLRTVAVRVGQISGTSAGAWQRAEWFPSMIKSSVYLGCIPAAERVRRLCSLIVSPADSRFRNYHGFRPTPPLGPSSRCASQTLGISILCIHAQCRGLRSCLPSQST